MRLVAKIVVGLFALIGFLAVGLALWLWLAARPVIVEAQSLYDALPETQQCEGPHRRPPGYPRSFRDIESAHDRDLAVYRAACASAGQTGQCFHMRGAAPSAGFHVYRGLYLSDCEMRALSLNAETPLHSALTDLYPGRDTSALSEAEQTCVAHRMRVGGLDHFCRLAPECCSYQEGLTPAREAPR